MFFFQYFFSPVYNSCLMCIHFLLDIGLLNVNLLYVFYILSIYYAGDNLTSDYLWLPTAPQPAPCRYQIFRDHNNNFRDLPQVII